MAADSVSEYHLKAKIPGSGYGWTKRARPKTKPYRGKFPREHLAGGPLKTIKGFVEANRGHRGAECLMVPGAAKGRPAKVTFCGKGITAAKYMLLLACGTASSEGMVVRHLCGNGHLSCVNPEHLAWGAPADNSADATKHSRVIGDSPQERMASL